MLKKLLILFCSFITASAFALDEGIGIRNEDIDEERLSNIIYFITEDIFGIKAPDRDEMLMRIRPNFPLVKPEREMLFRQERETLEKLQEWVQQAKHIRVKTIDQSFDIPVSRNTTVFNVKQHLQEREAIPVAQQSIIPALPVWWTLGFLEKYGTALDDNMLIKEAMNRHNTDLFELCLTLRAKPTSN